MRLIPVLLHAAAILVLAALPAHAGPVAAAIGAISAAIKGSVFLSALVRIVASVALSRLAAALAPKPRQPGIKTESTAAGSQNPASFVLGYYASNGVAVCPPMSHGRDGKTPNAYLTYVIELSDLPGAALQALIINNERVTLGTVPHADYGLPVVGGKYGGFAWVKFYDGTQTVADPGLLAKYGSYPERPWTADMVGRGICYAICTFRYNRDRYTAFPSVRFELLGIPVYDPRKDSTVGGSGAHRLNDPATWERTLNPIIMAYNAHLGFGIGGDLWGGGMPPADMPLGSVFAAANVCDALVDNGLGGTEPRFRAGYEVFVDEEPASVCEELMKACLGEVADVGGSWRFQAGDPALPTFFFTDDDLLVTVDREKNPFPGPDETKNGITASYPDPAVQWEPNEAPPVLNPLWEAEDGGQRRLVNVDFPAVPYAAQVQRNMRALIADDRRFLTHGLPMPPEATVIEPLDTTAWTSASQGYAGKTFEVVRTTEGLRSGVVIVNLREREPADTAVPPGYFTAPATPSTFSVVPPPQEVPDFAAAGLSLQDGSGNDRRPALELTWDAADLDGIRGVEYEVRLPLSGLVVAKGTTTDVASGRIVVPEGVVPDTGYETRTKLVSDRDTLWTPWVAATTPATLITAPDIAEFAVTEQFQAIALGPFTRDDTPNGTVLATVDMGAIGPGLIWTRGIQFDARLSNWVTDNYNVEVQRRFREFGGAFSPWEAVSTWTKAGSFSAANNVWDQRTGDGTVRGTYDDFEYRFIVNTRPTTGAGTYQWLRNIYLTVVRVTK